jgi:Tol biopolymer transport system component
MSGTDAMRVLRSDGTKIAFMSTRHGNQEIYSVYATGTGAVTRLTTNSAIDSEPAWGTNGKIAFSSTRHGNFEIHSMNADGTGVMRLTNHSRRDTSPHW